jgi:uncharacterized surface protein with fasciclin (FAS1) repeats
MARVTKSILFFVLTVLLCRCINDPYEDPKYKRPDWLAGKVYTQLKADPDLSTFTRCVELTGYDTIINVSGSYTVFAPNNEAFSEYFQDHPEYSSVEDIPIEILTKIVKYHILQNPWSKVQLRSLDVFGWIDTLDIENNEPKGYKRETLLLEKNQNVGARKVLIRDLNEERIIIIDSLATKWRRKISVDSRKYTPIFYKEYFSIYDLSLSDYEFYFGRPFENINDIYYANGRIIGDEIFAENGFVYNIDRVIEPLQNAYQILSSTNGGQYKIFLDMVDLFPSFTYNNEKTMDQPGAEQGLEVDSLFDLTYPMLTFNIYNEKTKAPSGTMGLPGNVTIRYHHGLFAPTNSAINEFVSHYLAVPGGWTTLEDSPDHIKRILVNTHMCINPVYKSDIDNGFYNGEEDIVRLDLSTVVQRQYGSNCTFLGINKVIVPRAFSSVTGPVYLQRGYSKVMYAIEAAGLLPALKREHQNYLFYVESDRNTSLDSSLVYDARQKRFSLWQITGSSRTKFNLTTNDLRTLLMNQVGTEIPRNAGAKKEFIKNLAGNYLIINNETGEVTGTAPTTQGYKGVPVTNYPSQLSTDADNGITYDVADWFNFSATTLFLLISTNYPDFHKLLQKAGLSLDREYRYSFISENDNYTVFVPTSAALNTYKADTLNINDLKKFLLLHFIQGELIFTDGNKPSGYYETARTDEKSTPYSTTFTQLYIGTDYDLINIEDRAGNIYLSVPESERTNKLAGRNLGAGTETIPVVINNGVIHEIDKVLVFTEVNVR